MAETAFVGTRTWGHGHAAAQASESTEGGRRVVDVSAGASAKGFSSAGAAGKGFATAAVDAPPGGWPTISIIVLSAEGKFASASALEQLAEQDYPLDRIKEIVVGGAEELAAEAPPSLRRALQDFAARGAESLDLRKELAACSGDVIAIWGDDHVSPAHRLKQQVAVAMDGGSASILQPTWFFDPVGYDFLRVSKWPHAEYQEFMEMQNRSVPEGFAKLMVCADPLTLCGAREVMLEASAKLTPSNSPTEELKELLQYLSSRKPRIIEDLPWAAVRAPPEATGYEPAKPEVSLQKLTQAAWPRGKGSSTKAALDEAVKEIKRLSLKPAAAIERLLAEDIAKPLAAFDVKRVRQALDECLESASGPETNSAVRELLGWDGLAVGKGGAQAARNFPVFYAAFGAVRAHVKRAADLWDMRGLGEAAEGLVRLAMKIWGTDGKVNEALAKALAQELYRNQLGDLPTDQAIKTADITGTLGLREVLETIAYAAVDMPQTRHPVDALASLAWGLSEANIENSGLQMKVARAIIGDVDKLKPPDVGKIFIALEEKRWFKDPNTIAYLTEALLNQIREMKKNDPGLARILAESQATGR